MKAMSPGGIMSWVVLLGAVAVSPRGLAGSIFDDDGSPPTSRPASGPATPRPAPAKEITPPAPPATNALPATTKAVLLRVPGEAEQAQARKLFRESFPEDLKDGSPRGRRSLANKLIEEADKVTDNATDRFVLLMAARNAAAEGGDVSLAFEIVAIIARQYDVDAAKLNADAALRATFKRENASRTLLNLRAGIELLDTLLANNDFGTAARLLAMLQNASDGDRTIDSVFHARAKRITELGAAHEKFVIACKQLKHAPNDPNANFIAGEYYCFVEGRFDLGLPMFSHVVDGAVRSAASADAAGSDDIGGQISIGDRWWNLAEKGGAEFYKAGMRHRAAYWYSKAQADGQLTGLNRTRIEKRLALVTQADNENAPALPAPLPRVMLFGNGTRERNLVSDVIVGSRITLIDKDETPLALKGEDPFGDAQIVVWGTNRWREMDRRLITREMMSALKRFVAEGGDLIVLEQFDGNNMDLFAETFGVEVHGISKKGVSIINDGLKRKALEAAPPITEDSLKAFVAYNAYEHLPAKTVEMVKSTDETVVCIAVAPFGRGRIVLLGSNLDVNNGPVITAALHQIYDRSTLAPTQRTHTK